MHLVDRLVLLVLVCNVPLHGLDPHSLVFVGITMWAQRLDPFLLKMTEAFTSVSGVNVVQVVGRSVNVNGRM